jgi:hypothetical protein
MRLPRRWFGLALATVLALTIVAALAIAGCGSTDPPSLTQLRAQGSQICSNASRRMERIGTPASEAGGKAFLTRGIGVLGPELGQLRTLAAPGEAAPVYQSVLEAFRAELTALQAAVRGLARQQNPVIVFKALQRRLSPLETQADDAWKTLQMPVCMGQ